MLIRLWAWITGGQLVWLKDQDGETTLAIAKTDAFGEMRAERWWPWKIHAVTLMPDGTVNGAYVKRWKKYGNEA